MIFSYILSVLLIIHVAGERGCHSHPWHLRLDFSVMMLQPSEVVELLGLNWCSSQGHKLMSHIHVHIVHFEVMVMRCSVFDPLHCY